MANLEISIQTTICRDFWPCKMDSNCEKSAVNLRRFTNGGWRRLAKGSDLKKKKTKKNRDVSAGQTQKRCQTKIQMEAEGKPLPSS